MKHYPEIILIKKPKGITSFDVIRQLRNKIGIKKMGHAGTLDPRATGLLIIGIGKGTKKLFQYIGLPKVYETEIIFGISTDTGDMDGTILTKKEVCVSSDEITPVLSGMIGTLELPVPAYSAIKRGGEALYKKARRGEHFELPIKLMTIKNIELLDMWDESGNTHARLSMSVGSGAYVRSVAEEIGRRIGTVAVVKELRRTKIGLFDIEDALSLEEI